MLTDDNEYVSILNQLCNDWFVEEIDHNISKAAGDALWKIASKWFHPLYEAKKKLSISKNVPQFVHLRRRIYAKKTPPIELKTVYEEKETGEVIVVNSESTPTSQFPRSTHTKIYEIAKIKVIICVI